MKPYYVALPMFLFLVGCTTRITTDVTLLGKGAYQPKPSNCDIQVLTQGPVDRQYEELAIINAMTDAGSFTPKTLEAILPSMKAKACEVGADAIIVKNAELGGTPMGDQYGSLTPGKAFGVAIKTAGSK